MNKMRLDRFTIGNVRSCERFLRQNKDILVMKADKGNTTVAINKVDYISRINSIVGDATTYGILNRDPSSRWQKINNNFVEELFRLNIVTLLERNSLKTNIAVAPKLYGLPKIHKEGFPLRPICSSINSPSYGLCKYITGILSKLTVDSRYNVRNSLSFKDKIKNLRIEENEKLISLDVVSLFPSIPVELAIRIIEDDWSRISRFTDINKDLFLRVLRFCIIDSRYFQFDNKIFLQKKGLPMGSPASPVVADIVMEKLIDSCLVYVHTLQVLLLRLLI